MAWQNEHAKGGLAMAMPLSFAKSVGNDAQVRAWEASGSKRGDWRDQLAAA